jgi:hypothetical protein
MLVPVCIEKLGHQLNVQTETNSAWLTNSPGVSATSLFRDLETALFLDQTACRSWSRGAADFGSDEWLGSAALQMGSGFEKCCLSVIVGRQCFVYAITFVIYDELRALPK